MPVANDSNTLTRAQIEQAARGAGFTGKDLEIAVAVALAESSGDPKAHNSTPPDNSYGLWQINMLGKLGPDRRKRFGLKNNEELYSPSTNARVAYGIWKGSGWKAWTTYTRGTYKKYMSGEQPITGIGRGEPPANPDLDDDGSIAGSIKTGLNVVGSNIFKSVLNINVMIAAIALIVLGVLLLARNVVPVGKLAKVAKKVVK